MKYVPFISPENKPATWLNKKIMDEYPSADAALLLRFHQIQNLSRTARHPAPDRPVAAGFRGSRQLCSAGPDQPRPWPERRPDPRAPLRVGDGDLQGRLLNLDGREDHHLELIGGLGQVDRGCSSIAEPPGDPETEFPSPRCLFVSFWCERCRSRLRAWVVPLPAPTWAKPVSTSRRNQSAFSTARSGARGTARSRDALSTRRDRELACGSCRRHGPLCLSDQPWAALACSLNPRADITLSTVSKSGLRSPDSAL